MSADLLSVRDGCSCSVNSTPRGTEGVMLPTSLPSSLGPFRGPPLHCHHLPVSTNLRYACSISYISTHHNTTSDSLFECVAIWNHCPNHVSGRRMVLGLHLSEPGSGSSPEKVWRHIFNAGQQSSSAHAGAVGEDLLWTHQRTHRV